MHVITQPLPTARKHFFWGAQFSFSSADVLCEVPYDPQLQMLPGSVGVEMTLGDWMTVGLAVS